MPESLLGLVLARLDAIRSPIVLHSETSGLEPEREALLAMGILRLSADAEEIPRPSRFGPGGDLIVRRTSRGIFGVAEEGNFVSPVPLLPEDILQYEVSVPGLVTNLRRENGIDGLGGEESDGLVPVGLKAADGLGRFPVFLSMPNDGEARLIARCHRIRRPAGAASVVVILPRAAALSPEGQQILDGLGIVLVSLTPEGRPATLGIDWSLTVPLSATGFEATYPMEMRIIRRRGATWLLVFEGEAKTVADSKGVAYIAYLLTNPSREIHCATLRDAVVGETTPRSLGSAGEVLSRESIQKYRLRLQENQEEQEEASARNDFARLESLQLEEESLKGEVARATGLGGRNRQAASDRKRAQQSVSKAIHRAITVVSKEHAALGRHLVRCLRIGESLSYQPEQPIPWVT